ncbi:hypothetical protein C7999DRAFT_14412 [Corynascus novoguineensis]|uniref:F-box domain-containing protein n=1 Tax=Corynascus novoguineensis TaxID=1126955 RepID=A0AAN7CVC8_9PEZI|nr:hypothetical protein C7999DRAFT_14412 [Corynascus novoguineensis]
MEPPTTEPHYAVPPLERLPLHILEYTCQYISRSSLFSLSLANRFCCQATAPQRFSRLRLTIRDKEKLRDDLDQWVAVLGRNNDRFRYVRRVAVIGRMADNEADSSDDEDRRTGDSATYGETDSDSDIEEEVDFYPGAPALKPKHKRSQHEAWLPFARFLGQLPALKDLVYACTHQIPLCVLTALHQHHPKSRLHLHTFSLRSLYQYKDELHDIHPDEFALATSPCLYSIHAKYQPWDVYGRFSFNLEALQHIVMSGCAPNLKHLHIHYVSPPTPIGLVAAYRAHRKPWKGFFHESSDSPSVDLSHQPSNNERIRSLETLVLSGDCPVFDFVGTPGSFDLFSFSYDLNAWYHQIDFSVLQRFELNCAISVEALHALFTMAASNNAFRSLRELALSVRREEWWANSTDIFDPPTSLFIRSLPPLEVLKLDGFFGKATVNVILRRHGQALRKLHLIPEDTSTGGNGDLVHELQQWCPLLENVRLCVRRRQGGPREVAIYRALERMPRLRRAELLLNCRLPVDETGDDVARVRKWLVNLAVDEILARAIFDKISAAAGTPFLKYLRLEIGALDPHPDFEYWAKWIQRDWICERNEMRGEVAVREIGESERTKRVLRKSLERVEMEGRDLWSDIWPRGAESEDWMDHWHSFPLSDQDQEVEVAM